MHVKVLCKLYNTKQTGIALSNFVWQQVEVGRKHKTTCPIISVMETSGKRAHDKLLKIVFNFLYSVTCFQVLNVQVSLNYASELAV